VGDDRSAPLPDPRPAAPLPRDFYARDSPTVARALLNKVLVVGDASGRIVEVEAYGGADDPASHAFRGRTARNATMFGRPGLLYVYFTYGMHWCANVVTGADDEPTAVLIRALSPLGGLAAMRARRPAARRDRDLTNGPAKLCAALGIDRALDGADLVTGDRGITIVEDGTAPPRRPGRSTRIGISLAREIPWRWYVPGDPHVSPAAPSHPPAS
jgi:DNA-3-methyladenine glycosylase